MSYIALYREWRPKTFNEIIGQDNITLILKNQIKQGRVAHAYLFCGTRGTGKTTTAKVLSKALNCLHPVDGEPCGTCEICTGIDNGNIMDVIEIDAASNNGVDNIRELRDDVKYLPSKCRYKVYIIDEVHMLSSAAFNALLKTLEEPPTHIVFILATTEFQKVPATIVSRCQRYDFKRIRMEDIKKRLREVSLDSGVEVDEKALGAIARSSDGAMRDALSVLDQCISLAGESIKYEDVLSILGITTDEHLFKIGDAVASGNAAMCITLIDDLIIEGKDVYQFIKDLTMHFRNLLISRMGDTALEILNTSEEVFLSLKTQTKKFSTESILRNINILSACESDAKWVSQPRIMLEMAVLRMCKKELGTDVDSLLDRIAKLENVLSDRNNMIPAAVIQKATEEKPVQEKHVEAGRESIVKTEVRKPYKAEAVQDMPLQGMSLQEVSKRWPEVLGAIRNGGHLKLWSNIKVGNVSSIQDGVLTIGFDYDINRGPVDEAANRKVVEDFISKVYGCRLKLRCILQDEIAADGQKVEDDEIVRKAKSIFGEDLVEVEE